MECKFESRIIELCESQARSETKLDEIQKYIESERGWRKAIVGIIFAIFMQVTIFAFTYGALTKSVNILKEANADENYDTVEFPVTDPVVQIGCPQCGTLLY